MADELAIATVVAEAIARIVAPLVDRVVTLEAADRARGRDLELACNTAGVLVTELAALKTTTGDLRERVAVVEAYRPSLDLRAHPGRPGAMGHPGLAYQGVFVEGKSYARGDVVTWAGSAWHCADDETATKPGDGATAWRLMVKRGRDGKDAR